MNFREWESLFSLMNQMRFLPSLRQLHAVIFCVFKMWMKEPLSMVVSCARLYAVKRRFGTVGPQWILWNSGILRLVNWGSAMHQFHPISPIIFVDGFPLSPRSNLGHLEGSAAAIAMNKCILVVMHAMAVWNSVFTVDDSEGFLQAQVSWFGTPTGTPNVSSRMFGFPTLWNEDMKSLVGRINSPRSAWLSCRRSMWSVWILTWTTRPSMLCTPRNIP